MPELKKPKPQGLAGVKPQPQMQMQPQPQMPAPMLTNPDIVIGGGAQAPQQMLDRRFLTDQSFLDKLDDQQYGAKRKSNII